MLHYKPGECCLQRLLENTRIKKQRHSNSMKCTIIMRKVYTVQGFYSCLLNELRSVNYSMAASFL